MEQKVQQHVSCGGELVKIICKHKAKALEPKALNWLFASPWAVRLPQLLPLGTDFERAVSGFQRCWFNFGGKEWCSAFRREK